MKNKKRIFVAIIITLVFGIGIGVSASTLLYSKDVAYDNSSSGLSSTNLQDALDELYEQASSGGASVSCDDNGVCTVTCKQGEPTITDNGYSCTTTTATIVTCPSDKPNYVATSTGYKCISGFLTTDLIKNVVTSGDGLYVDSAISGRYIYRGSNVNNYITFNDETWRIMSVESDGTIKIIRQNNIGNYAWDTASSRTATYCNYSSKGCNTWGSSSTTLNSSGTVVTSMPREYRGTAYALPTVESTLNQYLNGTYYSSLTSTAQSQIISHSFNVGVLAYNSGQATVSDVAQEKQYQWKGKIALANASDYLRASTNDSCAGVYHMVVFSSCYSNISTHNWLFNNTTWWTLTPVSSSSYSTDVWYVDSGGSIGLSKYVINSFGVRPVVFLSSDTTLSGRGTQSDPYTIN